MKKAIAIAIREQTFDHPGVISARNFFKLAADFMYGTPERARMTYVFAFALLLLGFAMQVNDAHALGACVNSLS